jgi:hypothetical protein
VIGISEARQDIRCILCKGSYYPSTTPHPFLNEITWQVNIFTIEYFILYNYNILNDSLRFHYVM